MKTKFFCMLITCFIVTSVFSQSNLNSYKYIIVAKKFDFLKEANQYRLNELTGFLFDKYGFEAVVEGEDYPEDLIRNRCLGLKADVLKDSGMFKTKLNVTLKDCNDKLVYTSDVGESREKDYASAYTEALRNAFKSIEALNYKYQPNQKILALEVPKGDDKVADEIQQLKQEIQSLKKEKQVVVEESILQPQVEVVKTVPVEIEGPKQIMAPVTISETSGVLYAQTIENGFQLVDSTPKVVYRIKKTGLSHVFLVENTNSILYKNDDGWVLEYYSNNTLKQEVLNVKF